MTRGRHRQSSSSVATIPLAAVGALAVCSGALAIFGSDTRMLRLGVSGSLAAAVAIALLLRARERDQARELMFESSARRREEALFHDRLQSLGETVTKLSSELVSLREELAEVTAAHSAAVLVATAPSRPSALTREAFLEAAAALGPGPERPLELVLSAPSDDVVPHLSPAPSLPMELRPVELAPVVPVQSASSDEPTADDRAATEPAAEHRATAEAAAEQSAAEPTDEHAVVELAAEPATDERGPATEQPGPAVAAAPEPEDAEVIDLTADDDTQPLRLTEVRKRA